MKKLLGALGALALVITLALTSCQPPKGVITITLSPSDTVLTVQPGQTVTWHITLTPDAANKGAIGKLTVTVNGSTVFDNDFGGAKEAVDTTVSFQVPTSAKSGDQYNVVFTATDANSGLSASVTVLLNVVAETYVEEDSVTMNWVSTSLTSNSMMMDLTKDGVQLENAESTTGQIAYVYNGDASVLNTLASPNADEIAQAYSANGITYSTDDKQVTFMKRVTTSYVWDNIDQATIDSLNLDENSTDYIANSTSLGYGVSTLATGDIVAFYNPQTNVKGFIRVVSFSTAKGSQISTTLTVDVKYVVYPQTETTK